MMLTSINQLQNSQGKLTTDEQEYSTIVALNFVMLQGSHATERLKAEQCEVRKS